MTESTTPPLSIETLVEELPRLRAIAEKAIAARAMTLSSRESREDDGLFRRTFNPPTVIALIDRLTSTLEENEGLAAGQYRLRDMLIAAEAKALTMERALEPFARAELASIRFTPDSLHSTVQFIDGPAPKDFDAAIAALRPIGDQSVSDGKELGLSRIGGETSAASVASDLTGPDSPGAER